MFKTQTKSISLEKTLRLQKIISDLKKEVDFLTVAPDKKPLSLKGILKGVRITAKDILQAKKSVFKI